MTDQTENKSTAGKNEKTENFPVASRLLPKKIRTKLLAYYAFARAADNIADDPLMQPEEKVAKLDAMEKALSDFSNDDVKAALLLRDELKATGDTAEHAKDLLIAFRQDALKRRYANWDELMAYCRYSAAPVGRQFLALYDIGEKAWPASDALCSVLQIINHLQDCADDYRELDRVYIPLDMLEKNGSSPEDLDHEHATPGLRKTMDEIIEKMAPMMQTAEPLLGMLPPLGLRMEISTIYVLAERMITRLKERDPLCEPTKLTKAEKIKALLAGMRRALFVKKVP